MTQDIDPLLEPGDLTENLRRRSVQAGAAVVTGQVVTNVLNLAAMMVLARLLTPGDFGLVAMVLVFLSFAAMLRDLGLTTATVQRWDIGIDQVTSLFWVNVGLSTVLTAAIYFAAPAIAAFYGQPQVLDIARALAFVSLIDGVSIQHQALLRRQLRLGRLTIIEIVALTTGLGTAISLAIQGAGYWALVWLQIVQLGTRTALCWLATGWRPALTLNIGDVKSMLSFGGFITGSRLLNNLTRIVDKLLIGRFASAELLGIYSKAYNGVLLPFDRVTWAFSRVAIPTLSRLQGDPERFRVYYVKAVVLVAASTFPVIAALFVEAKAVVSIVLGDQWLMAVPFIRILAPVAVVAMLSMTTRWVFVSLGRSGRLLKWRMCESSVKLAGVVIGVRWGAIGVAIGLAGASIAVLVPSLWYCFLETRIRLNDVVIAVWKPALASVVAALVVMAMHSAGIRSANLIVSFALEASLFFATYIAMWLLLPGGRTTLLEILSLAKELRRVPHDHQ